MKTPPLLFSLLLIICGQTFGQSCGTPVVKEPEKITFNRKIAFSYFVGVREFSDEDYQTYYRQVNYSGGWEVEKHFARSGCPLEDLTPIYGKIEVSLGGKTVYSKIDGSIIQKGFAKQSGHFKGAYNPTQPIVKVTEDKFYYNWPKFNSLLGGVTQLVVSPFHLLSESETERTYSILPVAHTLNCKGEVWARIASGSQYGSNLTGSTTISLSDPDTFEDAIRYAGIRPDTSTYLDRGGEAFSKIDKDYNKRVKAASVNVEALFKGCPESRWEVQMVLVKKDILADSISEYTERRSIRMNRNGEYVFRHKLISEEKMTRIWIKDIVAIQQPSCDRFDEHGSLGSIHWSASLGGNKRGESVGALRIDAEEMKDLTYTPGDLALSHRSKGTDVVRNEDESIRQVVTPTTIADVVAVSAMSYDIKLYCREASWKADLKTGIYPVVGTPFVTYTISQQIVDGAERLRIATTRDGNSEYREFGFNEDKSSETWTMREGSGARRTTLVEDLDYKGNPHPFVSGLSAVTSKITLVHDAADKLVSKVERVYELQTLGYGELVASETYERKVLRIERFFRESETKPAYEIFYTYGTDSDANDYNRLILRQDSRGPWKKWTYHEDGRVHTEASGYLNSSPDDPSTSNQMWTYTYSTVDDIDGDALEESLKTSTYQILGNAVEISYELELSGTIAFNDYKLKEIHQIKGHNPTAAWNAPVNIVSKRWMHVSDDRYLDGSEYANLRPDNTTVVKKRVFNDDGTATETICSGAAVLQEGVPASVSAGTITTREIAVSGATTSEKTVDVM